MKAEEERRVRIHGKMVRMDRADQGEHSALPCHAYNPVVRSLHRSGWKRSRVVLWTTKTAHKGKPAHLVGFVTVVPTHYRATLRTHGVRHGHAVQPGTPMVRVMYRRGGIQRKTYASWRVRHRDSNALPRRAQNPWSRAWSCGVVRTPMFRVTDDQKPKLGKTLDISGVE